MIEATRRRTRPMASLAAGAPAARRNAAVPITSWPSKRSSGVSMWRVIRDTHVKAAVRTGGMRDAPGVCGATRNRSHARRRVTSASNVREAGSTSVEAPVEPLGCTCSALGASPSRAGGAADDLLLARVTSESGGDVGFRRRRRVLSTRRSIARSRWIASATSAGSSPAGNVPYHTLRRLDGRAKHVVLLRTGQALLLDVEQQQQPLDTLAHVGCRASSGHSSVMFLAVRFYACAAGCQRLDVRLC